MVNDDNLHVSCQIVYWMDHSVHTNKIGKRIILATVEILGLMKLVLTIKDGLNFEKNFVQFKKIIVK